MNSGDMEIIVEYAIHHRNDATREMIHEFDLMEKIAGPKAEYLIFIVEETGAFLDPRSRLDGLSDGLFFYMRHKDISKLIIAELYLFKLLKQVTLDFDEYKATKLIPAGDIIMDYAITKAKCGICNFERPYDLMKEELRDFENHVKAHYSESGGNVIFSSEQQKTASVDRKEQNENKSVTENPSQYKSPEKETVKKAETFKCSKCKLPIEKSRSFKASSSGGHLLCSNCERNRKRKQEMQEKMKKRDSGKKSPSTNGNQVDKSSSQNKPSEAPENASQKTSELQKVNSTADTSKSKISSAKSPESVETSVKPPEISTERKRRMSKSHKSGKYLPKATGNKSVPSETRNGDLSIQNTRPLEITHKAIKVIEERIAHAKQKLETAQSSSSSTMSDSSAQSLSPSPQSTNKSLPCSPNRVDPAVGIPSRRGLTLDSGTQRSPNAADNKPKPCQGEMGQQSRENPKETVISTSQRTNQLSETIVAVNKAPASPSYSESTKTDLGSACGEIQAKRDRIRDEKSPPQLGSPSANSTESSPRKTRDHNDNIDTKVHQDMSDSSGRSPRQMISKEFDESQKRIHQIDREMKKLIYKKRLKEIETELAKKSRPKHLENKEEKHKAKKSGHKQQHVNSAKQRRQEGTTDSEGSASDSSSDKYQDDREVTRRTERLLDRLPVAYRDAVQKASPRGRQERRTDVTARGDRKPDCHSSRRKDLERIHYKSRSSSRDHFNPDSSPTPRSSPRGERQISRSRHPEKIYRSSKRERSTSGDTVKRKRRYSSPDSSHRRHEPDDPWSKRRSRSPYFSRSRSPHSPRSRSSYYSRSRSPHSPRSRSSYHSRSRSRSPHSQRSRSSYYSRSPHSPLSMSSYYSRSRSPQSPRSRTSYFSRSRSPDRRRRSPPSNKTFDFERTSSPAAPERVTQSRKMYDKTTNRRRSSHTSHDGRRSIDGRMSKTSNDTDLHIDDATRDQAHASESRSTVSGSDMGSSERDGGAKGSDSDMDISEDEAGTEKNLITVNEKPLYEDISDVEDGEIDFDNDLPEELSQPEVPEGSDTRHVVLKAETEEDRNKMQLELSRQHRRKSKDLLDIESILEMSRDMERLEAAVQRLRNQDDLKQVHISRMIKGIEKLLPINPKDRTHISKKVELEKEAFRQKHGFFPTHSGDMSMWFFSFCSFVEKKLLSWMKRSRNVKRFKVLLSEVIKCLEPCQKVTPEKQDRNSGDEARQQNSGANQQGVEGTSNAVDVQSILDKYFELMTKQPSSEAQRLKDDIVARINIFKESVLGLSRRRGLDDRKIVHIIRFLKVQFKLSSDDLNTIGSRLNDFVFGKSPNEEERMSFHFVATCDVIVDRVKS